MKKLAILVGGGPAPGINAVIAAATIEARNRGLQVLGCYHGFRWLVQGDTQHIVELDIGDVSRIHFEGGSILLTSRTNPTRSPEGVRRVAETLQRLGVQFLLTLGGDDTAFAAAQIAKALPGITVAHVPKTIDNDLPLPDNMPTFGFETARHYGTAIVRNLIEDSRTTNRWYFIVSMGRSSGHLALGIGKAAGATLAIIPEEFPSKTITLDQVCGVLEGAILKRRVMGRERGLAIIAEGIVEKLVPEELSNLPGVVPSYDQHGHIRLEEIPLEKILKRKVQERFKERGETLNIVDRTIGYELRSASPIPFDVDYTRTLGYGAVRALLEGTEKDISRGGGLVCLKEGRLEIMPFAELIDPATQRTRIRRVDINSESYRVARKYMIRLEKADLANHEMKLRLAAAAKMEPDEFERQFGAVAGVAATS
ncbi:MAG: 6-phosphofructokinase [Deltaproteobacteria bacterium]|nr:6-phosphofructokinase [Deltaproteobacteria bacterium]